ncbi:MAG: hypothetical protein QW222_02300 [Candidatus Bathyarchaeia archaeon]
MRQKYGFWIFAEAKGFFVGATLYNAVRDLQEKRLLVEYGLMLAVIGDMLGYPLSTYYRFRLLPYWLPRIEEWKIS